MNKQQLEQTEAQLWVSADNKYKQYEIEIQADLDKHRANLQTYTKWHQVQE